MEKNKRRKRRQKKAKRFFKTQKLNFVTCLVGTVALIIYLILFAVCFKDLEIEVVLSSSANYVAIASCILALIQIIAFVKDSRLHELRAKKERALDLAKEYAESILCEITFIENVLNKHCGKDGTKLEELVMGIRIIGFTNNNLKDKENLKDYAKLFENGQYLIDPDIIIEQAERFPMTSNFFSVNEIKELEKIEKIGEEDADKMKRTTNLKFRVILCNTMNILEYFAMSVNQNVAESEMIFVSLHQTYLKFVHYMYPYICIANKDGESYYTNVIKLYKNWKDKRDENDKENQSPRDESDDSEPLT